MVVMLLRPVFNLERDGTFGKVDVHGHGAVRRGRLSWVAFSESRRYVEDGGRGAVDGDYLTVVVWGHVERPRSQELWVGRRLQEALALGLFAFLEWRRGLAEGRRTTAAATGQSKPDDVGVGLTPVQFLAGTSSGGTFGAASTSAARCTS